MSELESLARDVMQYFAVAQRAAVTQDAALAGIALGKAQRLFDWCALIVNQHGSPVDVTSHPCWTDRAN